MPSPHGLIGHQSIHNQLHPRLHPWQPHDIMLHFPYHNTVLYTIHVQFMPQRVKTVNKTVSKIGTNTKKKLPAVQGIKYFASDARPSL